MLLVGRLVVSDKSRFDVPSISTANVCGTELRGINCNNKRKIRLFARDFFIFLKVKRVYYYDNIFSMIKVNS